jgi:hypothetical protein
VINKELIKYIFEFLIITVLCITTFLISWSMHTWNITSVTFYGITVYNPMTKNLKILTSTLISICMVNISDIFHRNMYNHLWFNAAITPSDHQILNSTSLILLLLISRNLTWVSLHIWRWS